ncbi:MAG TPA: ROK family protein [Thermoleophilaceae bacterium]|nr:ROK family protein [Thermoleophilaceae bacterium]
MRTIAPPLQSSPTGPGALLQLVRDGTATTRAELARYTGLARSTVAQRVDALIAAELLYEAGGSQSTGGRPPTTLAFNHDAGVALVADLGATHARLALSDLAGNPLAEHASERDIAAGPQPVLEWVCAEFETLLSDGARQARDVRTIGIGVPGPVEFSSGRPVSPPIMPGWDGFSVPDWFASRYSAPVLVDNDVNIMARGEHWMHWRDTPHLLMIKVGTGIGCGIVADGHIYRGARGAAGDIGHIRATSREEVVCRCGNIGCLEAVAGGQALADALTAEGIPAQHSRDVVELVRAGNPTAIRMVREAGRTLGEVLAGTVNFFNPGVIVVGGDIADAGEHLLAGVREGIFSRSLPLATRDLRIVPSRLGDRAGVIGAATMAIEHVLAPGAIDQALTAT